MNSLTLTKVTKLPIRFYSTPFSHLLHAAAAAGNYIELIETVASNRSLSSGRILHGQLITTGLSLSPGVASKLISFYIECGQLKDARRLFDRIPKADNLCWVTLIGALSRRGHHEEAMGVFYEMQMEGVGPDRFVIPNILKVCGKLSELVTGEFVHALVVKRSLEKDAFVSCALVDMYCKCGKTESARFVFDELADKDTVALNAMVSGYAQHGLMREALELVENVKLVGVEADLITWNTMISGFSHVGDALMVLELFYLMRTGGFDPDVVSWTSAISGFVQNFRIGEAFKTFAHMLADGNRPNSATISSLLPACAMLANVRLGKEIHSHAVAIGVADDIYVCSALIDMYAKCGLISCAKTLFDGMSERNTVSWNSMIFGLANHGHCNAAIETFIKMEKEDERSIDHLTFTAALSACSHGGMIEMGQNLFSRMQEHYGIGPRLEHYASMVDLLGRAGKLTEAYDLIKMMPMEPDLFVWGALLGGCRNHGNIELAEVAAQHLSKLEPTSAGSSLLLSGLYTNNGGWSNAARLKRTIKRRRLRKFLGCSWIETN